MLKHFLWSKFVALDSRFRLSYGVFGWYVKYVKPWFRYVRNGDKDMFDGVAFEISTYCNRRCDYCPVSADASGLPQSKNRMLDVALYSKVINELREIKWKGYIGFNFYNEPLYDKRLVGFVEIAVRALPKCMIHINTNGDLLTPELARELVRASEGRIFVNVTVHNLVGRALANSTRNMLVIKRLLGDKMYLGFAKDHIKNQSFNWKSGLVGETGLQHITFEKCWTTLPLLNIMHNGDAILCCQDYHRRYVFGNVARDHVRDIWKSPKFVNVRATLLKRGPATDLCVDCLGLRKSRLATPIQPRSFGTPAR